MGVDTDLTAIDLFAGAGGMSEGLRQAGFVSLYANDFDKDAMATYGRNAPTVAAECASIDTLDANVVRDRLGLGRGELSLLAGGPPCQGFSTYGKRSAGDFRNELYLDYLRFVEAFEPQAICIENVVGLLSMSNGDVVSDIQARALALGYETNVLTLDASEYGVPQYRKRVFIVGTRDGAVHAPLPSHVARTAKSDSGPVVLFPGHTVSTRLTVSDAISDLPKTALRPKDTHKQLDYEVEAQTPYQADMRVGSDAVLHHSSKQMLGIRHLRLALMHPGDYGIDIERRLAEGLPGELIDRLMYGDGMFRNVNECRTQDREKEAALRTILSRENACLSDIMALLDSGGFANKYRRLRWDDSSHTLVAHMARDCSDFVHPHLDRFISVREAARLQSFPDQYVFEGSQFAQFKQIGNAVPPLLAKALGLKIRRYIEGREVLESRLKVA